MRERHRASYGTPLGIQRRAMVRGATGPIRFTHLSLYKRPDGAGPFLVKLIERLADAAEARLRTGGSLDGGGWSLGADGLRRTRSELPVPISSLARAGAFQHHVSLWREGEERPFFSVRSDTPNALVLGRLIALRLRGKPETARAGELGRVLFEQRSRRTGFFSLVCGLAIGASYFWLTGLPDPPNDLSRWLLGGAAVLSVATGVFLWTRIVRRHEHGLSMSTLFGRREVSYGDIATMQYSEQAQYHDGIYTGTTFSLTASPAGGKPITFSTSSRGDKDDLDRLRSFLAERIAAKLRARLSNQPEVPWTPGVLLSKEGIRFQMVKFVGREEVLVRFSERPQYTIVKGDFQLSVPGRKGAQLRTLCSAENFYPGLTLFQALAAEAAKAV